VYYEENCIIYCSIVVYDSAGDGGVAAAVRC
jgi:hypothetical protein